MCTVCDHNYEKLCGYERYRAIGAMGGKYSPASVFNCRHTDGQRAELELRKADESDRAGRDIL